MIAVLSHLSTIILTILALSFLLPMAFDKVFRQRTAEPLLFYSPVLRQFIYQEPLGGHQFNHMDEEGREYSREEFEDQLPFLYSRNLERRNLLPVEIDGRMFSASDIAGNRQGLEIKARHLRGNFPQIQIYPLFNNDPRVAMMSFPVEMFRFTERAMEFINADDNQVDQEMTSLFTRALNEQGFVFPATVIGGKPTNLKPFDDGYFIRDDAGQLFHVRRVENRPEVVKLAIDPSLDILDIVVVENERREFHGVIITRHGDVLLISWDNYRLIPLPVQNYDPRTMDFKLLINPLYRTVTISSKDRVFGVAMDADYQTIRRYELLIRDHSSALVRHVREFLFPFEVRLENQYRGQADVRLQFGGIWSVGGILTALMIFLLLSRRNPEASKNPMALLLVLLSGFYGLTATALIKAD